MSSLLHKIHPNLQFREPTQGEILSLLFLEAPGSRPDDAPRQHVEEGNKSVSLVDAAVVQCLRDVLEAAISAALEERADFEGEPGATTHWNDRGPATSSFMSLPLDVQARIIRLVFEFSGRLVHCISRLDPFFEPMERDEPTLRPLHRFHISHSPCSVTFATQPNKPLAPLGTCKMFYFLGIHAFYGLNTFAFSSIGEFGRFCNGIGPARLHRIQHVELLWIGNQVLCLPGERNIPNGPLKYTSRRTWDLRHFGNMRSLRYLIIHINETGTNHVRRRHEPKRVIESQALATKGQPNARRTRAMRLVQGLDYVLQLRGLEKAVFYDFERHLTFGGRHVIRD